MCVSRACLLLAVFVCASSDKHSHRHSPPVVVTPSGIIQGSLMETRRGRRFQAFRGIRYAEPPIGELRFQPPQLILHYKETVNASVDGPACPMPVPPGYYVDEDCLMINVYTPNKFRQGKPLPVIFYIHAGGFYYMSGRSDVAGPHYFLEKDVVLVTFNYRLASLGFLSTGDKFAPGNNGLKDQVAALKWVKRNIASFGGDPKLVTIAGCSSGSVSVMLHMISPMSKGLFHRGISMSGSATDKGPYFNHMKKLAVKQAQLMNCPTNSSKAIVDCLKTKPWKDLGNSLKHFRLFGFDPVGIWMPVVELDFGQDRFLPIEPMDAIREGKVNFVPWIVSQTTKELFCLAYATLRNATLLNRMKSEWDTLARVSFMLPRRNSAEKLHDLTHHYLGNVNLEDDEESANALGGLYMDSIVGFPVHRMANLMCRHSTRPVYYYEFAYIGNHSHYEDPVTLKPTGAAHQDDLIYLFTMSYRFPTIRLDTPDNVIVERMIAMWYNFAKFGDPNPREQQRDLASLSWPIMTPKDRKYLQIGKEFVVKEKMFEDRYAIWEELYPIKY